MIPQVTLPKHTEARMAAAKAAKEAGKLKRAGNDQPRLAVRTPILPGEVIGLSVAARQTILECDAKASVGFGTIEEFVPIIKDANLAMLEYYVPNIIANHKYTTATGDVILLPAGMRLITERGMAYIVTNMKRELELGSYAISNFTKDKNDRATCMIRPYQNPVDMIHGLNALRSFGLSKDAEFLAMPNGPIMTTLERRAIYWSGTTSTLKRFLTTVSRELLAVLDQDLLAPAWAVYDERLRAEARSKA